MQEEDDAHATAIRTLCRAPAGFGVGWTCHLVPFHRSAKVRPAPELVTEFPTAVQADGLVQATPFKALTFAPAGLGVGWIRHLLPFHRSASVTPTPEAFT